jgi:hypothetical protein
MYPDRSLTAIAFLLTVSVLGAAGAETEDFHVRYAMPLTSDLSCGVDSLYVCARLSGRPSVSLATLEGDLHLGPLGVSAEDLTQACRTHGIPNMAVRLAPERLAWCSDPMVLHVNDTHFISYLGWEKDRLLLFDNQLGLFDCTARSPPPRPAPPARFFYLGDTS